jgi:hypothetical protein
MRPSLVEPGPIYFNSNRKLQFTGADGFEFCIFRLRAMLWQTELSGIGQCDIPPQVVQKPIARQETLQLLVSLQLLESEE